MTDEFPKNLGGWSGQGRTDARRLVGPDPDDLTWLRKRRPGVESRNKGGHLTVKVDSVVQDGWYSLGIESGKAVNRGSGNARGSFFLRGDAAASGSNVPQLFPRGDGSAFALHSVTRIEDTVSVFGPQMRYSLRYYITRDGKTPVFRPEVDLIVSGWDGEYYFTPTVVIPVTAGTRRGGLYELAFAYPSVQNGQHVIGVTFDNGVTQEHVVAARSEDNLIFPQNFTRLGPLTYVGIASSALYVLEDSAPPGYDQANVPGVFFFATTDGGATWFTFEAPELIAYEQANLAAFAASTPYDGWGQRFNSVLRSSNAQFVPLTRDTALVWAMPGSIEFDGGSHYEKYCVRYGVIDLANRTVSLVGTFYDPPFTNSGADYYSHVFHRYERTPVRAPGGGAIVQFNDADYPAAWTSSPTLHYTDGGPLTLIGTLPFQAGKTGIPSAVSATKLLMPVYDGEYSLYESVDRGLTWAKRATISEAAAAPVTGARYTNVAVRSFANVVWLRDNGAPKNATPGAPWLSDDRISPPS